MCASKPYLEINLSVSTQRRGGQGMNSSYLLNVSRLPGSILRKPPLQYLETISMMFRYTAT